MTKARKIVALFCVLVLVVGVLAACGNNNVANNTTNTKSEVDTNTGDNAVVEKDVVEAPAEPLDLTIMANLHTPEVPTEKIEKLMEEKTNTKLTIQWVPDGNYEEKLSTAFATGTMPQATYLKNITSFAMFKDPIRNDQFWEVGPLLKDYPNLSKLKPEVLQNTSVDGKIYSIYQGRPLSRQGLIYRKDWADKLGLAAPTTTAELLEMAKQFTEKDPDGDNKDNTIGLTDRSDLVYGAFKTVSSWFGTPNNWGEKDGQLLPEFLFQEYYDTMDFMKNLQSNGYINQDFPVTSKTDQQNMFKNGKAGMYIGSMGDVLGLYRDAIKLNPNLAYDVQNRIAAPGHDNGVWSIPGYGTVVLFPKSAVKDEAELKQILTYFDIMMSPELSNLTYWGIEGEHYKVSADGKFADTSGFDSGISDRDVKPYQALEIGEPATNGRFEGVFDYDVKGKAEQLIIDNESFLINDPTAPLDSATFVEKGAAIYKLIQDATYQYMLGDIDKAGFEAAVNNWKSQGGDKIIEEYNTSWANAK
ncbi:MAG: extracellular solute-binding protein [Paenibacillaceae bacterium]